VYQKTAMIVYWWKDEDAEKKTSYFVIKKNEFLRKGAITHRKKHENQTHTT
jgi:hypothetical protein